MRTPQEQRQQATEELRRWVARTAGILDGKDVLGLLIGGAIRIYRQNGADKERFLREMGQAWEVSPEEKTVLD
jgi:hypothetical protein